MTPTVRQRRQHEELRVRRQRGIQAAAAAIVRELADRRALAMQYMRRGLPDVIHLLPDWMLHALEFGAVQEGDAQALQLVLDEIDRREAQRS